MAGMYAAVLPDKKQMRIRDHSAFGFLPLTLVLDRLRLESVSGGEAINRVL